MSFKKEIKARKRRADWLHQTGNVRMPIEGGNPAGTKQIRKFYKAKHSMKATAREALAWYANWNPQ